MTFSAKVVFKLQRRRHRDVDSLVGGKWCMFRYNVHMALQGAADEAQERAMRGECGAAMDANGDHPHAGFQLRHDPIVELLGHALRELGCLSRVECTC